MLFMDYWAAVTRSGRLVQHGPNQLTETLHFHDKFMARLYYFELRLALNSKVGVQDYRYRIIEAGNPVTGIF